ncbi:DUF6230 family protein [Nocardioides limicola]|uniref:DUF6230 family protein n=1 Tax=Nocardioides limicola TaxID=2803368 RepID=UPI00193B2F42|nr:DUF6230 family protein [Nocardioides sp. DJM-14]
MKEKGMGRTRLGRFAAVTVPATAASLGLGLAIVQGSVSASLSSAEPFQVASPAAAGTGLELSMRAATTATSNADVSPTSKKSAMVTLKGGSLNGLCLAANQDTIIGNIGLTIASPSNVSVGDLDISADSVTADTATLPYTEIGIAENELDHQSSTSANPGGFGMQSDGAVSLAGLEATAYGLTLANGLTLADLQIAPVLGTASCS